MPITYLKNFEIWDFYSPLDHKLKFIDANYFPHVSYDNGLPCYEANIYMISKVKAGLSRKVKGSTLKTYAKDINHLIHYSYKNRLLLKQLNDDRFTHFIQSLQAERNELGILIRSNNHVLKIGRQCLDFLMFVGRDLPDFIGEGKENAIQVQYKTHKIFIEGRRTKIEIKSIYHTSLPTKDAIKKRFPVSEDAANKVWQYISTQDNILKRIRDVSIYQCLEQLGARIAEIHMLTVNDIKRAIKGSGENATLEVSTLKRRDNTDKRFIPVTDDFLIAMETYIVRVRRKVMKEKKISKENDHGFLFVSLTTGQPLQSDTITGYMNEWKKKLGIECPLHPHLFRHSFITNKLVELIRQHKINNTDEFRESILHTEIFKMKLREWTGHTMLWSLDTYINLAFAKINGYDKAYSAVLLNDSVKVMKQNLGMIKQQAINKEINGTEMLMLVENAVNAFEKSVERSLKEELT